MTGHRTDGNHGREATHRNQEHPPQRSLGAGEIKRLHSRSQCWCNGEVSIVTHLLSFLRRKTKLRSAGIAFDLPTNWKLTALVNTLPLARTYAFGWQGGSPQGSISSRRIASKLGPVPVWCRSAVESYPWSPSHDQCGMLRPFGTSSAEWW